MTSTQMIVCIITACLGSGGIVGLIFALPRHKLDQVMTAHDKKKEEDKITYEMLKAGTVALLHDRLYQSCNFYIDRGWIRDEDLKNIEYMYVPYHAMGGNGTCSVLFDRCKQLEIRS